MKNPFSFFFLFFFTFGIAVFSNAQTYFSLDSIGKDLYQKNKYEEALPLFTKAFNLAQKSSSKNDSAIAIITSHLGMVYLALEDYESSEQYYLKSLEYTSQNSEQHIKTLSNLGFLYLEQKKWENAEKQYHLVLDIIVKNYNKTHPIYLKTLENISLIHLSNLAFDRAEMVLLEAIQIAEKSVGKENPTYTELCFKLSQAYFKKNDFTSAEKLHLKTLSIQKKIFGNTHPAYLSQYKNLGGIYAMLGKFKEAESIFLESVQIIKKEYGTDNKNYLNIIANLGGFYQKTKQFDKAKKPLYESLALYKKIYGNTSEEIIHALLNLGNFYQKQGELDSAYHYAQQSLFVNLKKQPTQTDLFSKAFTKEIINFDFFDKFDGLVSLALISKISMSYYNQTKDEKYLKINLLQNKYHIQLIEKFRNEFVSDQDKINYSQDLVETSLNGLAALFKIKDKKNYSEEMLYFCEQNKSVLLEDAIQTHAAHQFGDLPDSLVFLEKELQQRLSTIKTEMIKNESTPAAKQSEYNTVLTEIKNFQERISKNFPKYHALKYQQKTTQLTEIQSNLPKDMAILEYSFFNEISFVLTITSTDVFLDTLPIQKEDLLVKIDAFLPYLRNFKLIVENPKKAKEEYARYAYQLYESCLSRPLSNLKNIKNLMIVADHHLGYIPFEILLTKDMVGQNLDYKTMPYLLNDFAISYSYSASLWQSNLETTKKMDNSSNLILGVAVNYNKKENKPNLTLRQQNTRNSLTELPSAAQEIQALEKEFTGTFWTDGTEKNFKSIASNFGIIHLAMHGIMDKKHPILSSLAFNSSPDSLEDDFLEAWEISNLKLQSKMVVLSACETGYGKFEQGEGIMSLARSFMYAGAASLVVSLWQVNDYSTAEIMKNFYKNLAQGMPKNIALQQAKLSYLKNANDIAAHPAFWSAFVQLGDSSPITISSPFAWKWVFLLGGIALVVGIFFIWKRKK